MALSIQMFTQQTYYANHYAPNSEWSQLYYALQNDASLNSKDISVKLNDEGEYTGWTYSEIASFVEGGGIWIDWCGWPLAATDTTIFVPMGDFEANFAGLAKSLGVPMGYENGPPSFSAVPSGFPYVRSLCTTGAVEGQGFEANPNSISTVSGTTHCYSSFAIRYGKGAYFYAFGNNIAYGYGDLLPQTPNPGVPFDQYWPFIQSVMQEIVGYKLTTSSGPGCSYYGTYKGQTSSGLFIYERQSGSDIIQTIVDSTCTPIGGVKTIAPTNCNSNGQYGTYVGTGANFGSVATDAVYMKQGSGTYTLSVIDPTTCALNGSFQHTGTFSTSGSNGTGTPTNCNSNGQYGTYVGTGADFGSVATDAVYMKQSSGSYTLYVVDPTTCALKGHFQHAGTFSASGSSSNSSPSAGNGTTLSTQDYIYAGAVIGFLGVAYWFLKRPPQGE